MAMTVVAAIAAAVVMLCDRGDGDADCEGAGRDRGKGPLSETSMHVNELLVGVARRLYAGAATQTLPRCDQRLRVPEKLPSGTDARPACSLPLHVL